MQVFLKKHGPDVAAHSIKVEWTLVGDVISIQFTVLKRTGRPWVSDSVFTSDWSKNWGLWNNDVVEAFLQLRSHADDKTAPYLELQLSPANQPFALIITEPRKAFYAPKLLEYEHHASVEGRTFTASMKVRLPEDLKGSLIYGGFFACLDQEPREFFALEPNPELAPDFHRPELFLPLYE